MQFLIFTNHSQPKLFRVFSKCLDMHNAFAFDSPAHILGRRVAKKVCSHVRRRPRQRRHFALLLSLYMPQHTIDSADIYVNNFSCCWSPAASDNKSMHFLLTWPARVCEIKRRIFTQKINKNRRKMDAHTKGVKGWRPFIYFSPRSVCIKSPLSRSSPQNG